MIIQNKSFYFLLVVGSIAISLSGCTMNSNKKAVQKCQDLVRNEMRAPRTTQFSDVEIKNLDRNVIEIYGLLDSENGFGALIRGNFTCIAYGVNDVRLTGIDTY